MAGMSIRAGQFDVSTVSTSCVMSYAARVHTLTMPANASQSAMWSGAFWPSNSVTDAGSVLVIFSGVGSTCCDQMKIGPALCHRGGISPLFLVTHDPSATTVAVAAIGAPTLLYAAANGVPRWTRVLAVFVPLTGLLLGHTVMDRLILVPLAAVCLAYAHFEAAPAGVSLATVILAGIGAGLVGTNHRCDAPGVVATDLLTLAAAGWHLSTARPAPPPYVVASLCEAAAVAFLIAADPIDIASKSSHLTWWGLVALAIFDYATVWRMQDSVYASVLCVQACVVLGVWFMSASECSLLADAQAEVGDGVYAIGNFAMHYWPSLRVLLHRPAKPVPWARQAVVSAGLVAIYLFVVTPKFVYGCDSWVTNSLVLVTFLMAHALCVMFGLKVQGQPL